MQKNLYLTGGALLTAVIALLISTVLLIRGNHHKASYIELHKVFAEFEMSKQYKTKLETIALARKNVIDSLELKLTATSKHLKAESHPAKNEVENFLYEKEAYIAKKEQFEEDNHALESQYNAEITKQLNQYIKDYGEASGFDYIYGAEGSGALMYADKSLNITDEVVSYVNERYRGINK